MCQQRINHITKLERAKARGKGDVKGGMGRRTQQLGFQETKELSCPW